METGAVEIKGIAREAGRRTKLAVASLVPGVDPVGTFVGGHGTRGYGRVSLRDFAVRHFTLSADGTISEEKLKEIADVLKKGGGSV